MVMCAGDSEKATRTAPLTLITPASLPDDTELPSPHVCSPVMFDTFPIALELRFQIFRYLLRSDRVKIGNRYHFQTSLLRVNKTFYEECHQVLFGENAFIVLDDQEGLVAPKLPIFGVTVVARLGLSDFEFHRLELRLINAWNRQPPCPWLWTTNKIDDSHQHAVHRLNPHWQEPKRPRAQVSEPAKILLAQEQLEPLITLLRFENHNICDRIRPVATSVRCNNTAPDSTITCSSKFKSATTSMFIHVQAHRRDSEANKRKFAALLLEPFKTVAGTRKIEIIGDVGLDLAREVAKCMQPKVAWTNAIAWDLIDLVRSAKDGIDKMADQEGADFLDLEYRYDYLATVIEGPIIPLGLNGIAIALVVEWRPSLLILYADLLLSCAICRFRAGQPYYAVSAISRGEIRGREFFASLLYSKGLLTTERYVEMLYQIGVIRKASGDCVSSMRAFKDARIVAINANMGLGLVQHIGDAISTMVALHSMPYSLCGISSASQKCSQLRTSTFENSGLAALEMVDANTPLVAKRPDGLIGWVDTGRSASAAAQQASDGQQQGQ